MSWQMKDIRILVTCGMILTRVGWYWHMWNDTDTCGMILTLVEWHWHMWNDTDTCGMTLTHVEWYWHVWNYIETCGIILTRVEWYWHVWNDTDRCWMILTCVELYWHVNIEVPGQKNILKPNFSIAVFSSNYLIFNNKWRHYNNKRITKSNTFVFFSVSHIWKSNCGSTSARHLAKGSIFFSQNTDHSYSSQKQSCACAIQISKE
jgi:hypothetical protein